MRSEAGVVQEVAYRGHVPHLIEERVYGPIVVVALRGAAREAAPERQHRHVRLVPRRSPWLFAARWG